MHARHAAGRVLLFALAVTVMPLSPGSVTAATLGTDLVYSTNNDFDEGTVANVDHLGGANQLKLSESSSRVFSCLELCAPSTLPWPLSPLPP